MDDFECTAVILTAVEIETQSVKHLYKDWHKVHIRGDSQVYYETYFMRGEEEYKVITCQQKVMGMTAATMLAAKATAAFHPRYLIMSGIAAGIGEKSAKLYGDVLVPDMIWDYSTGKYVGTDESEIRFGDLGFLPRPTMIHVDDSIMDVIRNTVNDPENEFHITIGPMACGSYVVANGEVVNQRIKALFPKTVGLDMESYSVLFAAENAKEPKPLGFVVKSICDYADSAKSDQYQRFAAYTSSGYVKYLLEKCLPL